jgi:tRNA (guanine37-N1)-methyltransferase
LATSELPSEVQTNLAERPTEVQLVQYTVRLGYDFLQAEDVLGHLLPAGITVPSGHEEVGHIIHLNLRDEHELYRHLIAHVLLEKVSKEIKKKCFRKINFAKLINNTNRLFPPEN